MPPRQYVLQEVGGVIHEIVNPHGRATKRAAARTRERPFRQYMYGGGARPVEALRCDRVRLAGWPAFRVNCRCGVFFGPFSTMACFNGWFSTRWYAMLYSHRDGQDAASLVLPLIAKGGLLPGQRVLDMACGRGRHAQVLIARGLEVTGIDLTAESIQEARRLVPGARFEVFDMREPFADGYFDAAVCLFTSLGYTGDAQDDQRAVDAAAKALKPGGLYVLDLINGSFAIDHLVEQEAFGLEGVRFQVRRKVEGAEIIKQVHVEHDGGVEEFQERVHSWSLPEVEAMVRRAGLHIFDVTDGTAMHGFDALRSEQMVIWARKPS